MEPDDFKDKCSGGVTKCWLSIHARTETWDRLFPQKMHEEPITFHYAYWDMYVHWYNGRRGRSNRVIVCKKHSLRLWQMWGVEGDEEVRTSQALDAFTIAHGGRMG